MPQNRNVFSLRHATNHAYHSRVLSVYDFNVETNVLIIHRYFSLSFCRRWYYNRNQREEPIEDSPGRYVVRDGSLIIHSVQESDAGSYMCTASNSEGSESMEVRLTVSAPLSVHVQPSIQTVDLGKAAHLVIDAFRGSTAIY